MADLRRQDAVGARRDRARESNARADEGHGRASKRRRMQAEIKAAELAAKAREAHKVAARLKEVAVAAAAATAKKEARARGRSSSRGRSVDRRGNTRGRATSSRARLHDATRCSASPRRQPSTRQSEQLRRGDRSRGKSWHIDEQPQTPGNFNGRGEEGHVSGRARRNVDRGTHGVSETGPAGAAAAPAVRGSQRNESARPLAAASGKAKPVVYDDEVGGSSGSEGGSSRQEPGNLRRQSSGRRRGWRDEFWVPSGVDDENMAMERRLQHLDELAARLEQTEAGLGAKLDKIGSGNYKLRQSAVVCSGPTSNEGRDRGTARGRRSASVRGGSEPHDKVYKFRHRAGASPARRRRTTDVSRGVSRVAAPTISSNLKTKSGPAGVNAAGRSSGGGSSNSHARRRREGGGSSFVPKGKGNNDNERRSRSGKFGHNRFATDGVAGGCGGGDGSIRHPSSQRKECISRVKRERAGGARAPAAVVVASMAAPDERSERNEEEAISTSAGRQQATSCGDSGGGDEESKRADHHRQDLKVEEKDSRNYRDSTVVDESVGRGTDRAEHGRGRGGGDRKDTGKDRRSGRYDNADMLG